MKINKLYNGFFLFNTYNKEKLYNKENELYVSVLLIYLFTI